MDKYRPGEEGGPCDYCQKKHAERKPPGTPPCESCRVELRDENEEAATIYMMTRRQIIMRFNGKYDEAFDISILAIKIAMDLQGVKNQKECLARVVQLFHRFENERRKE